MTKKLIINNFMKLIFALVLVLAVTSKSLQEYTFSEYIRDFGKVYSSEELLLRQMIFSRNLEEIVRHNSRSSSYKMGVN
jgi:hypothetical protein